MNQILLGLGVAGLCIWWIEWTGRRERAREAAAEARRERRHELWREQYVAFEAADAIMRAYADRISEGQ